MAEMERWCARCSVALHHGSRRGWFVDKKHHSCTWIRHEFISLFYEDVAATLERLVQSS
jgi:hypothetical protein